MISISKTTYSLTGMVIFNESAKSVFTKRQPRLDFTKTLDGGGVFNHLGLSAQDRVFDISASVGETTATTLKAINETETEVIMSCKEGCFLGYIESFQCDNGELKILFHVSEELS